MDVWEVEEVVRVVNLCVRRIKWCLRPLAKSRLETDALALCTGLRPVVMVDYGGKMPELQERLSMLMHYAQKESDVFRPLRVMVIEDMIYIIHVRELSLYALSGGELQPKLVDLEQDPPKILEQAKENTLLEELVQIQQLFSSVFPLEEVKTCAMPPLSSSSMSTECRLDDFSCGSEHAVAQSSGLIDLTSCLKDKNVTIPTLNGWLLGYPIVYLFSKDHIEDAIYNLSTKSLHLYKIVVCRKRTSNKRRHEEELMSFSVPYDLSLEGKDELWAKAFLARMKEKLERCKNSWLYLKLEVDTCCPRSIVL